VILLQLNNDREKRTINRIVIRNVNYMCVYGTYTTMILLLYFTSVLSFIIYAHSEFTDSITVVVKFLSKRSIFLKKYKSTMFNNPRWREQP